MRRTAITFHRAKRSKASFHSRLDDVAGIGPKKKKALIRQFGSVTAIKNATIEELATVEGINASLAEQIKAAL
jgi:excinuclease ABC subunit C